jgi:hypothetical protein
MTMNKQERINNCFMEIKEIKEMLEDIEAELNTELNILYIQAHEISLRHAKEAIFIASCYGGEAND